MCARTAGVSRPSTISKLPPLDMACSISCRSDSPKLLPVLLRREGACGGVPVAGDRRTPA